jgi:hypothetical protein
MSAIDYALWWSIGWGATALILFLLFIIFARRK